MPSSYRLWQSAFRAQVPRGLMLGLVRVVIVFATRTGRMRPDIDNAAGAVLDALQPETIPNDRDVASLAVDVVRGKRNTISVTIESMAHEREAAWAA